MIQMLVLIKNSKKIANKEHFPSISLASNNSKIHQFLAQNRQNKTLIKFAATNRRNDSLESLDSLYDLSHEDAMAKFGVSDSRHVPQKSGASVVSTISQFNMATTPSSLFYPK